MITKISLLLGLLLSFSAMAQVRPCRVQLRPAGIYYNQCPRTMVAQGMDVWNPGPSPYPQVRVQCADIQIVCANKLKKDLHKEIN